MIADDVDSVELDVDVNGEKTVILTNERQRVYPILSVQGSINLTYKNSTYELTDGVYKISNFYLTEGDNIINLSGNGSIKFTYRMGAL